MFVGRRKKIAVFALSQQLRFYIMAKQLALLKITQFIGLNGVAKNSRTRNKHTNLSTTFSLLSFE